MPQIASNLWLLQLISIINLLFLLCASQFISDVLLPPIVLNDLNNSMAIYTRFTVYALDKWENSLFSWETDFMEMSEEWNII